MQRKGERDGVMLHIYTNSDQAGAGNTSFVAEMNKLCTASDRTLVWFANTTDYLLFGFGRGLVTRFAIALGGAPGARHGITFLRTGRTTFRGRTADNRPSNATTIGNHRT